MSLRYRYRGEIECLAALFASTSIISLNTKKRKIYAVIMHSHFSEFNDNAETFKPCHGRQWRVRYNKTKSKFKSHYILKGAMSAGEHAL